MQDDPRFSIADPICTFVFAGLVLLTTRAILRDISDILMERVPRSQNAQTITSGLLEVRSDHSYRWHEGKIERPSAPLHLCLVRMGSTACLRKILGSAAVELQPCAL